MLLIVSSGVNLARRYGTAGASRLRERIDALSRGLVSEAGKVYLAFPDDSVSATTYGFRAIAMNSSALVARAIWALQSAVGFTSGDALLIVGGHEIVPFAELSNPAAGGIDPDIVIQSDNPYGFSSGRAAEAFQAGAVPDYAVGRLPDFEPANIEDFAALVDSISGPVRSRNGTFAVVNEAWFSPTAQVLDGLGTIRTTPPWSASNAEWKTQNAQLLYFNLHGFNSEDTWKGFDDGTGNWCNAISPADVVAEAVSGSIVFAENCYAALVTGKSCSNSVALSMLTCGVRAFVGSTGMAYGSFMQQPTTPIEADVLGGDFVRRLREGEPAGQALALARSDFSEMTSDEWNADRYKTISEFVLYGNPLATL